MSELHGPGAYDIRSDDSDGDEGDRIRRSTYKDPSKVLMLFVSLEKYSEGFFLVPIPSEEHFVAQENPSEYFSSSLFVCLTLFSRSGWVL